MTLQDALLITMENNLAIQVEGLNVAIAESELELAKAFFDPSIYASFDYEDLERRQNAIEFTSTGEINIDRSFEELNYNSQLGVTQTFKYGTEVDISVRQNRAENTITEAGGSAIFNPEYESYLGFSITQPLLKNFGTAGTQTQVNLARIAIEKSNYEKQLAAFNSAIEVANLFYDTLFGQQNLAAKRDTVTVAQALLDANRRREEAGRMAPIDVSVAEVRLSEAEEEAWIAESFLNDRKAALAKYLSLPDMNFSVSGSIADVTQVLDSAALINTALVRRPDLLLAHQALEEEEVRNRYARNQVLPELNVRFSYGTNGLFNRWNDSFEEAFDLDEPELRVGISFSMPLSDRSARAQHSASELAVERTRLQIQELELAIRLDIENAMARMQSVQNRIRSAERSFRVAQQALEAEQSRLENGQSTTFDVIQLQETQSSARTRLLASRVDAVKALNELYALSGQLLTYHGLVFEN